MKNKYHEAQFVARSKTIRDFVSLFYFPVKQNRFSFVSDAEHSKHTVKVFSNVRHWFRLLDSFFCK